MPGPSLEVGMQQLALLAKVMTAGAHAFDTAARADRVTRAAPRQ